MLQQLIQQAMSGALQNNPMMASFTQMMSGKNTQQQLQTLMNLARSKGIPSDQKIFSEADLRALGLKK